MICPQQHFQETLTLSSFYLVCAKQKNNSHTRSTSTPKYTLPSVLLDDISRVINVKRLCVVVDSLIMCRECV